MKLIYQIFHLEYGIKRLISKTDSFGIRSGLLFMMGRSLESRLHAKKNKILYFIQLFNHKVEELRFVEHAFTPQKKESDNARLQLHI